MAAKTDLQAEGKDLSKLIADARKRSLNFAMLIGKSGVILQADRKKSPEMMKKAAKSAGGGRGTWGVMSVNGKVVVLHCDVEPPGNLAQLAKKHFAERGQSMRIDLVFGDTETPGDAAEAPQGKAKPVKADADAEAKNGDDDAPQDLAGIIARGRKRTLNFACMLGEAGPVLKADMRKPAMMLVKQAKSEGGSARGGWGQLHVEGKVVVLTCEEDPPDKLARALKVHMRAQGVQMGVRVVSPGGEQIEDADAPGADARGTAAGPAGALLPLQSSLIAQIAAAAPGLAKGPAAKLGHLAVMLPEAMAQGNLIKAGKIEAMIERLMPVQAAEDGAGPVSIRRVPTPDEQKARAKQATQVRQKTTVPRRLPVSEPMDRMALSIHAHMVFFGRTRSEASALCQSTEAALVRPASAQVTQAHVEVGYIVIGVETDALSEISQEDQDAAVAAFGALSPEAAEAVNATTDARFWAATGMPEGSQLDPDDPNFGPLRDAWLAFRADQMAVEAALARIPPRLAHIFAQSEAGTAPTAQEAARMARIALRLDRLDDAELAAFLRDNRMGAGGLDGFELAVDGFLQARHLRTNTAAGDVSYVNGPASNTVLASMDGNDIRAKTRTRRDFAARDLAVAYARSLGTPAAVVIENGAYVIYVVDLESMPVFGDDLDIDDIQNDDTANPDDTRIARQNPSLVALVTEDDYVVNTDSGAAEIDRVGTELDPFTSNLQSYGRGMHLLEEREQFEDRFELLMRDTAYRALEVADIEAQRVRDRLNGPMNADDSAAISGVIDALAPINAALEAKETEIWIARAKLYAGYAEWASRLSNPALLSSSLLQEFISTGTLLEDEMRDSAEVDRLLQEAAALRAQQTRAAIAYPMVLRLSPEEQATFMNLSAAERAEVMRAEADGVIEDIATTRENIDDGDFDFWTMAGIRETAVASMDLQGDQLAWAKDRAFWEETEDTVTSVGTGVLAVGLAVGAGFATGGAAWVLGGASLAVGAADAVSVTNQFNRESAAANISLDPTQGLIPAEDVPHWGWVAAAWLGLGLDAAGVAAAVRALRTGSKTLGQVAKDLGVAEDVLRRAMAGGDVSTLSTRMLGEEAFGAEFGQSLSEAATLITRNADGTFNADIVVRAGSDPALRQMAVAEELRHLNQLNDPAWADDVARLTEDALAGWPDMSQADQLQAVASQLRLEADSQSIALEALRRQAGTGGDPDLMSRLALQIDEAEQGLARYTERLASVEEGLRSRTLPAGIDLSAPPRLFNTPQYPQTAEAAYQAMPELRDAMRHLDRDLGLDPDNYYFVREGDGFGVRRFANAGDDVPGLRIEQGAGGARLVRSTRRTVAETRASVEASFSQPSRLRSLEASLEAATDQPYRRAYARKFVDAFDELGEGAADEVVRRAAQATSDAAYETALRQGMRDAMVRQVSDLPGPEQAAQLQRFFSAMPDNASRGALFTDYRRANMGRNMQVADRVPGDLRLAGTQSTGDGIADVTRATGSGRRKGPRNAGDYLMEDKSSANAFDITQFDTYMRNMNESGEIVTANGRRMTGLVYTFPDRAAAASALEQMGDSRTLKSNVHIAFFQNGVLKWLR